MKNYLISTDDTKLWTVKENEITKYQKALEDRSALANATHIDSIESFDEYDLDEANQEVDDFLAGLSDDDEEGGKKKMKRSRIQNQIMMMKKSMSNQPMDMIHLSRMLIVRREIEMKRRCNLLKSKKWRK